MRDLAEFRAAVREHRRVAGRTQHQLARSIGLHPHVLSHKLHGTGHAVLTTGEVVSIITTLAGWGALTTRTEAEALLAYASVPPQVISPEAWATPPLSMLVASEASGLGRVLPRPPAPALTGPDPAESGGYRLSLPPLPAPATPLIGRVRERGQVAAALAASRLVTLTGTGGIGKTRLALAVASEMAAQFRDGVAFVDLAPVSTAALLTTAIAAALGLAPPTARAAEDHLTGALRSKRLLLVLDNMEQLLEGAPVLGRILAAAPDLQILATSRIALGLYGEHPLRVSPLGLPGQHAGAGTGASEAVQLFLARAQASRPGFDPGPAELAAIGEICTAVDGLPLAIELAAARVRLYPPQALLPLLHSRLSLLTGGPRDLPHRQQTLRATLDWSHALLRPAERALFSRLGVFAGPFDAPAAAAVGGDGAAAADMVERLAGLAAQGLLEVIPGDPPLFRLLQTVREYALARLAETGEQDAAGRRHLAHYLSVAAAGRESLEGPGQAEWLDRLELAYPDVRDALAFACTQAGHDASCLGEGLRLAAALRLVWARRGPLAEGMLHLDHLLALDDTLHASAPQDRAAALLTSAWLATINGGDYARAAELAGQSAELYTQLGDHEGLALAHLILGENAIAVGDNDAAEPHYRRMLAEASQAGSARHQAEAYLMLGEIARRRGDFRRAGPLFHRSLRLYQMAGQPSGMATVLNTLGGLACDQGQPGQARRYYHASLRRHAEVGHKRGIARDLEGFAAAATLEQAFRQALVYLGAAQALREEAAAPLYPADQAVLTRLLAPAVAALPAQQRNDALSEGRNQPLPGIISRILNELPPPGVDDVAEAALHAQVAEGARRNHSAPDAENSNGRRPG